MGVVMSKEAIAYAIAAVIYCVGLLYALQTKTTPNDYICTDRQFSKAMLSMQECYNNTDETHEKCFTSSIIRHRAIKSPQQSASADFILTKTRIIIKLNTYPF